MNTDKHLTLLAAASGFLFLSACGGGGGGGGGQTGAEPLTLEGARSGALSGMFGIVESASTTFGSVAIQTGPAISAISTSFDGQRATVNLMRDGASTISLDTNDTLEDFGNEPSFVQLPGRTGRLRYVFDSTGDSATIGLVATDWANNDPLDYLAGGYWLHVSVAPLTVNFGAFVDGPELDLRNPPDLAIAGTASYVGSAAGMYAARYGTDAVSVPAGSEELGEFVGTATLTADFGDGTMEGCVGCRGDVYLSGVYIDSASGDIETFVGFPTDYEVTLGSVSIDRSNATFQGSNVSISHPEISITQSGGTWAGQFSNRLDGEGDPRLVAGTFGGEGETAGGSRAVFLGTFAAGKE